MASPAVTRMEAAAAMFHLRGQINKELRHLGLSELLTLGPLKAWGHEKPESFVIVGVEMSKDVRACTTTVTFRVKGSKGISSLSLVMNNDSGQEEACCVIPHAVVNGEHYVACVREPRITGYFDALACSRDSSWMNAFARGFPVMDAVTRLQEPLLSRIGLSGVPDNVTLIDELGQEITLPVLRGDVRTRLTRLTLRKLGMLLLEKGESGFALRKDLRATEWRFLARGLENPGNSSNQLSTFSLEAEVDDPALLSKRFTSSDGTSARFYKLSRLLTRVGREEAGLHDNFARAGLDILRETYFEAPSP